MRTGSQSHGMNTAVAAAAAADSSTRQSPSSRRRRRRHSADDDVDPSERNSEVGEDTDLGDGRGETGGRRRRKRRRLRVAEGSDVRVEDEHVSEVDEDQSADERPAAAMISVGGVDFVPRPVRHVAAGASSLTPTSSASTMAATATMIRRTPPSEEPRPPPRSTISSVAAVGGRADLGVEADEDSSGGRRRNVSVRHGGSEGGDIDTTGENNSDSSEREDRCCIICFEEVVTGDGGVQLPCCGGSPTPSSSSSPSTAWLCPGCIFRHANENGFGNSILTSSRSVYSARVVECPRCRNLLEVTLHRNHEATLWNFHACRFAPFDSVATHAFHSPDMSMWRAVRLISYVYSGFIPLEIFVAAAGGDRARAIDDADALVRWGLLTRRGGGGGSGRMVGDDVVYTIDPGTQTNLRVRYDDYNRGVYLGLDVDDDEGVDDVLAGGRPSAPLLAGFLSIACVEAIRTRRFVTALRLCNQTCTLLLRSAGYGWIHPNPAPEICHEQRWRGWIASTLNFLFLLWAVRLLLVMLPHLVAGCLMVTLFRWVEASLPSPSLSMSVPFQRSRRPSPSIQRRRGGRSRRRRGRRIEL